MIYKVIVEFYQKFDDEFGTFTRSFTNLTDAMNFIEEKEQCYSFKIKVLRKNG